MDTILRNSQRQSQYDKWEQFTFFETLEQLKIEKNMLLVFYGQELNCGFEYMRINKNFQIELIGKLAYSPKIPNIQQVLQVHNLQPVEFYFVELVVDYVTLSGKFRLVTENDLLIHEFEVHVKSPVKPFLENMWRASIECTLTNITIKCVI